MREFSEGNFFDYFEKHAFLLTQVSSSFLNSVSSEPIDTNLEKLKSLEHEADDIVNQCLEFLRKSEVTSAERQNVYHLISSLDEILDGIGTANVCLATYEVEHATPELRQIASLVHKATLELRKSIHELRFSKTPSSYEIEDLKNEADRILSHPSGSVYAEGESSLLIIKWTEIYEILGDILDRCVDVAKIIKQ